MIETRHASVAEPAVLAAERTMMNACWAKVLVSQASAECRGKIGTIDCPQADITRVAEDGADKGDPHDDIADSKQVMQGSEHVGEHGIDSEHEGGCEPEHAAEGIGTREVGVLGEERDDKGVEKSDKSKEIEQRIIPGVVGDEKEEAAHGHNRDEREEFLVGFQRTARALFLLLTGDEGE